MSHRTLVIGGAGRIGLPFAVANALADRDTYIFDTNLEIVNKIKKGETPYKEEGLEGALKEALDRKRLHFTTDPKIVFNCRYVVLTIGTPIDAYLKPDLSLIYNSLKPFYPYFNDQFVIIRSTVAPGSIDTLFTIFKRDKIKVELCYCPERAAQGDTLEEIKKIPQIISAVSPAGLSACSDFFAAFSSSIVELSVPEAELVKVFTNAYRYTQFAIVNEFFMLATSTGIDYKRVEAAMRIGYPRLADLPASGFTAGPCLRKDTMLLNYAFPQLELGKSALWVNEKMPKFLIDKINSKFPLYGKTVGVLGLAFKNEIDDKRDSLSCRLVKLLKEIAYKVLVHDPYVIDDEIKSLDKVLNESDLIIIATPHELYKQISYPDSVIIIDIWNYFTDKRTSLAYV